MEQVTTIGLDIAKSVFLVHGVDAAGHVVLLQKLSRGRVLGFFDKLPRCLVGIEACASSHYWARELITQGHEVKLMPAAGESSMPRPCSPARPVMRHPRWTSARLSLTTTTARCRL